MICLRGQAENYFGNIHVEQIVAHIFILVYLITVGLRLRKRTFQEVKRGHFRKQNTDILGSKNGTNAEVND